MKNFAQTLKSLVLALILVGGISYVFAWTGPSTTAPNGNVAAPINVGTSSQFKVGALSLGTSSLPTTGYSLDVAGKGVFSELVASKQFCLGIDCITAWPTGGGGLGSPQLDTGWLDYYPNYDTKIKTASGGTIPNGSSYANNNNVTNNKINFSDFPNSLGTNPDNFVVDMEVKETVAGAAWPAGTVLGVEQLGMSAGGTIDLLWENLTATSIGLDAWHTPTSGQKQIRIRIWDTSKSGGTSASVPLKMIKCLTKYPISSSYDWDGHEWILSECINELSKTNELPIIGCHGSITYADAYSVLSTVGFNVRDPGDVLCGGIRGKDTCFNRVDATIHGGIEIKHGTPNGDNAAMAGVLYYCSSN